jgi:cell cycle serine/threonine-protein kinase CDC5/MSD2
VITHIDKNYKLTRWTLSEVIANAIASSFGDGVPMTLSEEEAKLQQKLLDKLKYCKEVLGGIRNASAEAAATSDAGDAATFALKLKCSKATLR